MWADNETNGSVGTGTSDPRQMHLKGGSVGTGEKLFAIGH